LKRIWIAIAFLASILLVATSSPTRLIRLTIVNRSGLDLEIELTGSLEECDEDYHYFLHVQEGDRLRPTEKIFTILPDKYTMSVYYVELWDPVYGAKCSSSSQTIDASRNIRVVVSKCTYTPPNAGEPSMVKFGGSSRRRGR
jgi:hypothetical protein